MASVTLAYTTDDIEYVRHDDRPFMLRLFRPAGAGPFPTVIVLHPGGWAHGDLSGCQPQGEAWAQEGFAVVSLDFRQGADQYPSSLTDINTAVRWVKSHAADLRIDPDRVALSGYSSGGHLAMLAAMRPNDRRYAAIDIDDGVSAVDATVRCVGVAWPVINPLSRYRHAKRHLTGEAAALWAKSAPEDHHKPDGIIENHHLYWADEDAMAEGNPLLALERGESLAMPPTLWVQGKPDIVHNYQDLDSDVDVNEPERFARLYRAAGGEIEVLYIDYATRMGRASFQPLAAFFHKHLS
ncbi:MAG: alpha/beta hydrolase [Alphaproteobacteria bacterium]